MNLPNKLTVLRVFMIPFFVLFMLTSIAGDASKWIALAIFIVASLTDMADGKIARKYNLVSKFGIKLDAVCDKIFAISLVIPAIFKFNILIKNVKLKLNK